MHLQQNPFGVPQPLTTPELHAALSEALASVEAETNGSVSLDGSSAGYKKFAEKVKVGRGVSDCSATGGSHIV